MRVFVLFVAGSVWTAGGPAWGQTKDQTSKQGEPSDRNTGSPEILQRGTKDAPFVVEIEAPPNQPIPEKTQEKTSDKDVYDMVLALSTAAAAIFTCLLWRIGCRGVDAALRTLDAIEHQGNLMEIAQAGSVGITHMSLVDRKPELNSSDLQAAFERSRFEITLTNTGPSKALRVRFTVNAMISGIPGLITHTEDIKTTESSDLHPNVPMTRSTDILSKILPNSKGIDWRYAVAGHLTVDGTLVYEDIFGNDYETEYRARAIGATSAMPFSVLFELISNEKKNKAQRKQPEGR